VHEYGANRIKKSVVGVGHANKSQVVEMVSRLLGISFEKKSVAFKDAADALVVAITHAYFRVSALFLKPSLNVS